MICFAFGLSKEDDTIEIFDIQIFFSSLKAHRVPYLLDFLFWPYSLDHSIQLYAKYLKATFKS